MILNGKLDVGKTTFFTDPSQRANTGVFTAAGGNIDIYSVGDVNVDKSRMMT